MNEIKFHRHLRAVLGILLLMMMLIKGTTLITVDILGMKDYQVPQIVVVPVPQSQSCR